MSEDELARFRGKRIGFVFQFFHLLPSLTAYENVRVPLEIAGTAERRAARRRAAVGSRPRTAAASLSVAALGRRAAARRDRARARQRSRDPAGRRAHRESRQRHRPPGHRSADRRQPQPQDHGRPRHARSGAGRARRRDDRAARRARVVLMNFVLLMALREIRASWRRLLFFFVCVAIGVGAIVLLRSVIQTVRDTLTRESRARDRAPTSSSAPTGRGRRSCARISTRAFAQRAGRARAWRRSTWRRWCGRPKASGAAGRADGGAARRCSRRFRSTERSRSRTAASTRTSWSRTAARWSGRSCSRSSASQVGDRAARSAASRSRSAASSPRSRAAASVRFSFGSRVLVDLEDLKGSGLLTFGSRANYRLLLKVDEAGVAALEQRAARAISAPRFVGASSFRVDGRSTSARISRAPRTT